MPLAPFGAALHDTMCRRLLASLMVYAGVARGVAGLQLHLDHTVETKPVHFDPYALNPKQSVRYP